jgi:hypothetical protein
MFYRVNALAAFTSYSIGHNVGARSLPAARCGIHLFGLGVERDRRRRSASLPD